MVRWRVVDLWCLGSAFRCELARPVPKVELHSWRCGGGLERQSADLPDPALLVKVQIAETEQARGDAREWQSGEERWAISKWARSSLEERTERGRLEGELLAACQGR